MFLKPFCRHVRKVPNKFFYASSFIALIAIVLALSYIVYSKQRISYNPPATKAVLQIDKNSSKANSLLEIDNNAVDQTDRSNLQVSSSVNSKKTISIPGYKSITIKANSTKVSVPFHNPSKNNVYFTISLLLDDGTELYKSKLIKPGKEIPEVTLSKKLNTGTYKAYINYQTHSLEDQTPKNGAKVAIDLIAK